MPGPSRQSLTPSALGFSWVFTHGHRLAGARSASVFKVRMAFPFCRRPWGSSPKKAAQAWIRENHGYCAHRLQIQHGITRG
jgi:hypothetical protein